MGKRSRPTNTVCRRSCTTCATECIADVISRSRCVACTSQYREPVEWLRCFRGIDTLTAILILAELHDFRRFHSPRALMAYLGLVPGEDSTGDKHRRGPHHTDRERLGAPGAGGNGLALPTPARGPVSGSRAVGAGSRGM
jgi:hypothetical protein